MNVLAEQHELTQLQAYFEEQFVITGLTTQGYMLQEKKDTMYKRYRFVEIENEALQRTLLQSGWVGTAFVAYNEQWMIQFRQEAAMTQ